MATYRGTVLAEPFICQLPAIEAPNLGTLQDRAAEYGATEMDDKNTVLAMWDNGHRFIHVAYTGERNGRAVRVHFTIEEARS